MRNEDKQLGRPGIIYTATEAEIALLSALEGMIAQNSDSHVPTIYNGGLWLKLAALNLAQTWSAAQTHQAPIIMQYNTVTATYTLDSNGFITSLDGCTYLITSTFADATMQVERVTSVTNAGRAVMAVRTTSTGDMADGFGPIFAYRIKDDAGVNNTIAETLATRDGADNSGRFQIAVYVAGTFTRKVVANTNGVLLGNGILATTAPGYPLHGFLRDAGTNDIMTVGALERESSGTPGAGFGGRFELVLESSAMARQIAAAIDWVWTTATHASRTAYLALSVVVAGVLTEIMRLSSAGVKVTGSVEVGAADCFYLGDPGTDGSWRITRSGNNLVSERRESGAWVTKQTIVP